MPFNKRSSKNCPRHRCPRGVAAAAAGIVNYTFQPADSGTHRLNGKGPKGWGGSRPSPRWPLLPKRASPHRYKTWQEAAGQRETAVKLERLPPGLDFPEGFPEPIAYDAVRRLLVYRGLMTHA